MMRKLILFLTLMFSMSIVYGLVPTLDSYSVNGPAYAGVDFTIDYSASGTDLTNVLLYNLDTRALISSTTCSGSVCSGSFTVNFAVGDYNLFFLVRSSDGSKLVSDDFAVSVTEIPSFNYYCDNDVDGQAGTVIDGTCLGVGCIPANCYSSPGLDCDDTEKDVYYGAPELCDGLDNDCDVQADEDFSIGNSCTVGVGACEAVGTLACLNDYSTYCAGTPGTPSTEVCDNVDNDCNGVIDNGLSRAYFNQVGVCNGATESCSAGTWVLDTIADYEATESTCDNKDNDCDGVTDENSDASCDDGLYCNGVETCSAGSCSAGTAVDCSSNNLGSIGQCDYDSSPLTWDFFAGFTSTCNEVLDSCTTSIVNVTSECSISSCGASCELDSDCPVTDCSSNDYCVDSSTLRTYQSVSSLCVDCGCADGSCVDFTDSTAPLNTNQEGVCAGSYQTCSAAAFADNYSIANYEATEVTKDHLDNDCDGSVDEGLNDVPVFLGGSLSFDQHSYLLIDLDSYFTDSDTLIYSYVSGLDTVIDGSIANVTSLVYGNFTVSILADDGFGDNVTGVFDIEVNRVNLDVPVVESYYLTSDDIYTDTAFMLVTNVTDSDPTTIESEMFVNNVSVFNGSDTFTNTSLWVKDDNVSIKFRACDWSSCSVYSYVNFTVLDSLPVLTLLDFSSSSSPSGDDPVYACMFDVSEDPDGDWYTPVVQFLWRGSEEYNTYFDGNETDSYNTDEMFLFSYNITERLGHNVAEVGTVVGCNVTLYQGSKTVSEYSEVTIVNDAPELISLSLLRDYSSRGNDLVYYTSSNATFDMTRTIDIIDYLGADYYIDYETDENDIVFDEHWKLDQTYINVTLWNGTVLSYDYYVDEEIVFPDEVGNYTFTVEIFDELGASTGIVTVNVDLRDYAVELPTLICNDMNISDGWENVGAFACTCSNNYLGYLYENENRTVKLSNTGDYLDSFNMSVDLLSVYDYDLTLLSESNPFNQTSAKAYQWFPLWENTNKTYTFDVTCTNEVGSVTQEVVVDVAEGDYDFVDSFFVGVDVTNVTGNGLNETLVTVPTDVNATEWVFGYNDVLLMQKFLGTNDLSLIVPITNLWENITDPNGHVGGLNSENRLDRLSYNMTQMMQYYRSLDMAERYFLNSFEPDWTPIACSIDEYYQGVCIDGYTKAYGVKVIKIK